MRVLLIVLASVLASISVSADPVQGYYDPTFLKLKQEKERLKAERKIYRRTMPQKQLRLIHITLFVAGGLLLWYEQSDHKK